MGRDSYKYTPVAAYQALKAAEVRIQNAQTFEELKKSMASDGVKIGYKAYCYLFMGKMTPEAMKPDEAAVEAIKLESEGDIESAQEIFRRIVAAIPEHPLAKDKVDFRPESQVRSPEDELIDLLEEINVFPSRSSRHDHNRREP